jgi:all-trans-retinol 13,14-reductase
MRAFIGAKIGLSPFVLFWALASFAPSLAVFAALGLSAVLNLWRLARGAPKQVEIAGLALFVSLAVLTLAAPEFAASRGLPLSFFGAAFAAFLSLARAKPWTADYAASARPGESESPIFIGINKALSSLWMTIFAALGLLVWLHAPPVAALVLTLAGALLSIFGPYWLIRAALARKIAVQRGFDWPAPDFAAKRAECELDVAIIGAGLGGLAAAAVLSAKGLKVKVFEQHVVPGGYCHSWLRKAQHDGAPRLFRFDAGPHDFSGAFPGGNLDRLLNRLGCADRIEWLRLDHRFIRANGDIFDPPRDWPAHAHALADLYPEDAEGIVAVFEIMKALFDPIARPAADFSGPPPSVDAMLVFARKNPVFVQWAERPFVDLLGRHIRGEGARTALLALIGYISDDASAPLCAEMAPIFGYYFEGGFYPRGGTSRFAETLAESIAAHGGTLATKTTVAKILVENGRACGLRLESGEIVRARAVVANSDPRKTFLDLLDAGDLPARFRETIAAAPPAVSGFGVHLAVKGEWEGRPLTFIAGEPEILIARPGLVDPSDAPEGYSAVDLLTLLPHDKAKDWLPPQGGPDWRDWRRTPDYLAGKQALAETLIAQAEKALPGLRERIVLRCEASPLTYARYDFSSAGAIYGIAPQGRLRGSKSPIPGLYVAGAINLGPGVEAAVLSGIWAAEAIAPGRDWGRRDARAAAPVRSAGGQLATAD